jgi:ABC-type multidrug transport system ATPase subunit
MIKVFVNDKLIHVLPGMTVRHALILTGLLREVEDSKKVYDEWRNEVGLDGALSEGMKLYVK